MTTKAAFLTAVTATTLIGATKAISAASAANDTMTATAHGKVTGFGPVRLATDNALPAGLATATNYWLIVVDANTVKFASSEANALAGTAVDITGTGTGNHTMQCTMQTLADSMEDSLNQELAFPGNKDMPADINVSKFWARAILATF